MRPAMTPMERAEVALQGGVPDFVPTMEIDFELNEQLLGKKLILGITWKSYPQRTVAGHCITI